MNTVVKVPFKMREQWRRKTNEIQKTIGVGSISRHDDFFIYNITWTETQDNI